MNELEVFIKSRALPKKRGVAAIVAWPSYYTAECVGRTSYRPALPDKWVDRMNHLIRVGERKRIRERHARMQRIL